MSVTRRTTPARLIGAACLLLPPMLSLAPAARAGTEAAPASSAPAAPVPDFTAIPIEDLVNVEIYSVSKHTERVADAPAAATVITQDDIRRSGIDTIPDLLRLAPGLDVGRINADHWAITSRGFNDLFSNKLLVLMDGRSVYTPLFSGVYWETVDYLLQDLDRIEVVRGPGATLWGANAVNGVINITTKSARDTQGWLVTGEGSNIDGMGAVRYGGKIDDQTFYRVYAKYRTTDNFPLASGEEDHDGWDSLRGGFRLDRYASDRDTLTIQGDGYTERFGETVNLPLLAPPQPVPTSKTLNESGAYVLGRWTHVVSESSDFSLQLYYDHINRNDLQLRYALDTFDADFQHRFALAKNQEVIWGLDARFLSDSSTDSEVVQLRPRDRDDYLVSGFIQDDITVVPEQFHFIIGTKLEENSYSGFEVQPSARALWTPNDRSTIWGAVSRAVRTPSRWEEDARFRIATFPAPGGLSGADDIFTDGGFDSEELLAYELGYKIKAAKGLTLDVTAFYNDYDRLRSVTNGTPFVETTPPGPHVILPTRLTNEMDGETFGAELAANWTVNAQLRVQASYTWLDAQLHRGRNDIPTLEQTFEGSSPHNQAQLHVYYDILRNLEVNTSIYYVDHLKALDIPSYIRWDVAMTWRPDDRLELSVGVRNLLDDRHPEWNNGLIHEQATETPRTVYAEATWRY